MQKYGTMRRKVSVFEQGLVVEIAEADDAHYSATWGRIKLKIRKCDITKLDNC